MNKNKRRYWTHGLELDNLKENNIKFKVLKQKGWDNFLIEIKITDRSAQ